MRVDERRIGLGKITPNIRSIYENEVIEDLSRRIQNEGQLEPIQVWFAGDSFRILDGEKRWRACRKIGMTHINALIIKE
jgi:ParB family transcriptional regulator, chromosome partitioning protein